jgi:hypothetical protein
MKEMEAMSPKVAAAWVELQKAVDDEGQVDLIIMFVTKDLAEMVTVTTLVDIRSIEACVAHYLKRIQSSAHEADRRPR